MSIRGSYYYFAGYGPSPTDLLPTETPFLPQTSNPGSRAGSLYHELRDAQQYSRMGVDYLKFDDWWVRVNMG